MIADDLAADQNIAVTVVVPCRNEEPHIEACVRSILAQEQPPGGFELIVADGLSTDRTRDILDRLAQEDDRLKLIDNPGRIVSTGLNAGIAVARGKVILRMDAHTVYATDYIRQCVAVLQETGADNVGGPALTCSGASMQAAISAAYHSSFAVGGALFHNPGYEGYVDTVPYGCWPRTLFSRIGLFDEELVRNQDDEFNLRIVRSGGKVWQSPRIRSWYRTRSSLSDLFRQYRQYGYWKVRVIQKHRLPASIRHIIPAVFVLSIPALVTVSLWWPSALWVLAAILVSYMAATLVASLLTASQKGWAFLPVLPFVFATYHLSYGLGFLQGMVDFLLFSRSPTPSLVALSRSSASR